MPVERGRKLGPYEILELLGKGGMGEVYRARDAKLARDVAIKVLPEEFSKQRERLERFEREARLLAQLNHTNIATLYGFEESDGEQFLVMELVEGETLAESIARGPIPIDEVLTLFIQIAEGLEAAHEKGIIHRDLKPPNIKITPDGKVQILDFGLAKAFASDKDVSVEASQAPTLTKGTALGVILGTASYMSPEQARGKPVDRRTDVWAFGCCLFEACTGKLAFSGETVPDTIAGVLDREPPWANLGEVSSGISRLLRKCLTKDPHHRPQSVGDARVELELAPSEPVVLQAPSLSISRPKLRLAVVGAFLLGLVVAALISGLRSESSELRVERFVLPLPEGEELYLAKDFQASGSVAISPDGRHIAFVTEGEDSRRLYLRKLDQTQSEFVEGSEGARTPFFSPDSQWLGFHTGDSLKKVSVAGLAPVTIGENSDPRGATWSVDGTIVTTNGPGRGLIRFSADGGEPRQLTRNGR